MREIPQCWLTGQAAGVAAAIAADSGVTPADVPIAPLRKALRGQGAYLNDHPAKTYTASDPDAAIAGDVLAPG